MKRTVFILLLLISCEKIAIQEPNRFIGQWEIQYSEHSLFGMLESIYFCSSEFNINGSLHTYSIQNGSIIVDNEYFLEFIFDKKDRRIILHEIVSGKLIVIVK